MQFEKLDDLYREVILDHYRNPRNHLRLTEAQIQAEGNNPFCGDEIALQVHLSSQGDIQEVGLQGRGCSISQASASMMTEVLKGKTLADAEALNQTFRRLMRGEDLDNTQLEKLGDLEALEGVRQFPVRIKCALLAWATLEEGMEQFQAKGP